jgi:hypothetical protein
MLYQLNDFPLIGIPFAYGLEAINNLRISLKRLHKILVGMDGFRGWGKSL